MLPIDLKLRVLHLTHQMGISLGEFIRESLEARLRSSNTHKQNFEDPLYADRKVYAGKTPKNLSKEHDQYLYENLS